MEHEDWKEFRLSDCITKEERAHAEREAEFAENVAASIVHDEYAVGSVWR